MRIQFNGNYIMANEFVCKQRIFTRKRKEVDPALIGFHVTVVEKGLK